MYNFFYSRGVLFMHTHFIIRSLLITFFFLAVISCNKDDENNPADAQDGVIGTYKTETPILIKIQTDFCSSEMEDVATIKWDITWKIVKTNTPDVYSVTMTYTSSDYTVINSACDGSAGYAPEPSPMFLTATIDGTVITVQYAGETIGKYDDDGARIIGDLAYSYCYVYCQKIYTEVDEIVLIKL
jgi:hypothetical protein